MKSLRVALLVALLLIAGVAAYRAWTRWQAFEVVEEMCVASSERRWSDVLAESESLVGSTVRGRRAAECRCTALMETDQKDRCVAEMEELLADPETEDWLPFPILTAVLVEARRDAGRLPEAAQLAHRGSMRYPGQPVLFYLELALRRQLEDESEVLSEMGSRARRLRLSRQAQGLLAIQLSAAHVDREDWDDALLALGDELPDPELRDSWYRHRADALAGRGDLDGLQANMGAWEQDGGDSYLVRAVYVLLLSTKHLDDPSVSQIELMAQVVESSRSLDDRLLLQQVWTRLVGILAISGLHDSALEYFDRGIEELGSLEPIRRDEILRSATNGLLDQHLLSSTPGHFRIEVADPRPGDRVLVSPDPRAPLDQPFVELEVPTDGVVELDRSIGVAPLRWVLTEATGSVVGSGTAWPVAEQTVTVMIERLPATLAPASFAPEIAPADGRARVVVALLDCGDWRLARYVGARGEMPVFESLLGAGWRAVLASDPPFTAIAVQKLVTPQGQGTASFFGVLHLLGTEIEALNFVAGNPAAALRWVLPEREDLFTELGAGDLMTVNMLHAYGPLDVGRHGEVIGPNGERGQLPGRRAKRSLTEDERTLVATDSELFRGLLDEMAADFDALVSVAQDGHGDLVVLRVASLDLMTHGLLPDAVASGQDNGKALLLGTYRYVDRRLGEVWSALDADDVLVVMSDHGIRTAMEHDLGAIFVAVGGDIPVGRAVGTPDLRGVGKVFAEILGVETTWPDTGVGWASVARGAVEREAAAAPLVRDGS